LLLLMADGWTTHQAKIVIQDLVAQALDSLDPKLRRAALQIIGLYPDLLDSHRVATLLLDKDPSVNTLACQLLLRHPSRPLAKAALNQLMWLAKTGQPRVRAFAVDALVKGGGDRYGEWSIPLDVAQFQRDSSARVRLGVLPAANIPQLIQAAQDSSPAVRLLAIERLRGTPFYWQTSRTLWQELERFPSITPQGFQIQQALAYWHLLGAIASLTPRTLQEELPRYLEEGFKHLDWLTSARIALRGLDRPQLAALIAQLDLERIHLLQAILQVIGQIHGQRPIQQAARQLALAQHPSDQLAAIQPLTQALGQASGGRLAALLSAPRQHEQLVSESPGWQVVYPPEVMRGLLTQQGEWFGILVLYSVIPLPSELADPVLVQALIQRCQHSPDDTLREALWPLQRAFESQQETPKMLSTIERMIFLRKVQFFENLRLDQLRTLANLCEERTLASGEWLLQQGEAGDSLAVLVEGGVSILDASGVELSQHQAGDVLGEISLFDGGLRSANAQATAPTLALMIYREALYNALADDPAIAMDLLRAMAQLVRQTTTRLNQLVAYSDAPSMD
jgi:HEAT repeat protein